MGLGRCELAAKQLFCENFPGDLQVGGDVLQNLSEGSDLQDSMGRDRDVVFSTPEFGTQAYGCRFGDLLHNRIFEAIARVLLRSDRAEASSPDDLILHHVQADDTWLGVLSKMTGRRFAEHWCFRTRRTDRATATWLLWTSSPPQHHNPRDRFPDCQPSCDWA